MPMASTKTTSWDKPSPTLCSGFDEGCATINVKMKYGIVPLLLAVDSGHSSFCLHPACVQCEQGATNMCTTAYYTFVLVKSSLSLHSLLPHLSVQGPLPLSCRTPPYPSPSPLLSTFLALLHQQVEPTQTCTHALNKGRVV